MLSLAPLSPKGKNQQTPQKSASQNMSPVRKSPSTTIVLSSPTRQTPKKSFMLSKSSKKTYETG